MQQASKNGHSAFAVKKDRLFIGMVPPRRMGLILSRSKLPDGLQTNGFKGKIWGGGLLKRETPLINGP